MPLYSYMNESSQTAPNLAEYKLAPQKWVIKRNNDKQRSSNYTQ